MKKGGYLKDGYLSKKLFGLLGRRTLFKINKKETGDMTGRSSGGSDPGGEEGNKKIRKSKHHFNCCWGCVTYNYECEIHPTATDPATQPTPPTRSTGNHLEPNRLLVPPSEPDPIEPTPTSSLNVQGPFPSPPTPSSGTAYGTSVMDDTPRHHTTATNFVTLAR